MKESRSSRTTDSRMDRSASRLVYLIKIGGWYWISPNLDFAPCLGDADINEPALRSESSGSRG